LEIARANIHHPGSKGDASERVWKGLLETYLPKRYSIASAHVVDSEGGFSEQIDIVVFDRQYTPFVFDFQGQKYVPAESVYAVFECKQTVSLENVRYAHRKIASVRTLARTSLPLVWLGERKVKEPEPIIGGLLALESQWKPALGAPLLDALAEADASQRLEITCVASHGLALARDEGFEMRDTERAATHFILGIIEMLQQKGTVPMLDISAYSRWLG
jgi:hypothetical protein